MKKNPDKINVYRDFLFAKKSGDNMTDAQILKLNHLIENNNADAFYHWKEWERLRLEVLRLDHNECQICKAKGKYRRAIIVHHVKHLKDRPDLALSIWHNGERQLVSVCKQCHEDLHPERVMQYRYEKKAASLTEERWD